MAENETSQVTDERSRTTSFTVLLDSEAPRAANDEIVEIPRPSSTTCCDANSIPRVQGIQEKFRSLKRRSSVENFGQFGFLVPALALFPQADGVSNLCLELRNRLFNFFDKKRNDNNDAMKTSFSPKLWSLKRTENFPAVNRIREI